MADQWWSWMVAMSWQVLVLAALVWIMTAFLRKGPAGLRTWLWMLVLIKLLMPPFWATPWSVGTIADRVATTAESNSVVLLPPGGDERAVSQFSADTVTTPIAAPNATTAQVAAEPKEALVLTSPPILITIWGSVAALLFLGMIVQYQRYRRRVARGWSEAPARLTRLFEQQRTLMKVRARVTLRLSPGVTTPAVFGLWKPVVLMPEGWAQRFTEEQLTSVLGHELAHVRRGDLYWGWLLAAITCVYWFHPVVWWVSLNVRREREMACDDLVLNTTQQDGKKYASTILSVAESFRGRVPLGAGALGVLEIYDHLLHRIRSASDAKRVRRLGWRAAPALLAVVLALPMGVWPSKSLADTVVSDQPNPIDAEIEKHYAKAHPEVQEFIRHTAKSFGRAKLWFPETHFDELKSEERKEKVAFLAKLLEEGEYGRHLCSGLAQAGALKDKELLAGVTKVAAYHRDDSDYDCRPKWMAVAALGRIGDEAAVPTLVPLVDHGNTNTRMWARASLVRLTKQTFDTDKQAWADWWNAAGKEPKLGPEHVKPWVPPGQKREQVAQAKVAPKIVSVSPPVGTSTLDPKTTDIRVTFDQDMQGGFSWTGGGDTFPELIGKPKWIDKRTCALTVKLKPGKFYIMGINSPSNKNFQSTQGVPSVPIILWFVTAGADGKQVEGLAPPQVVSMTPTSGTTDLDAGATELRVTFDRPMKGSFSWTNPENKFPEMTGDPSWSADQKTSTLPVKLEAGGDYVISLNSGWYINFQSEQGIPLVPVRWTFTTK